MMESPATSIPASPTAAGRSDRSADSARQVLRPLLRAGSMFLLVTTLASLAVLGILIVLTRGQFAQIFEDFDTKLPQPTQWLMDMPLAVILLLLGLLAAALIAKEIWVRNTVATIVLNILAQGMLMVLVLFYVLALWLPLVKLITALTGS